MNRIMKGQTKVIVVDLIFGPRKLLKVDFKIPLGPDFLFLISLSSGPLSSGETSLDYFLYAIQGCSGGN
jgi:hypothetical protein